MNIELDDSELQAKLESAAKRLQDTKPLMRGISMSLMDAVEENFAAQGRPKWAGLNPHYAATRKGTTILQVTGQLAASVTPFHSAESAGVSTNKEYAAIHQFGGTIKPKHKKALSFGGVLRASVTIPARPYMPMDKDDNLQPEARDSVLDVVEVYLEKAFD